MPKSQTSLSGEQAPKGMHFEISPDGQSSRLVRDKKESPNVKIGRTTFGKKPGETKKEATKRILSGKGSQSIAGKGRVVFRDEPVAKGQFKGQNIGTLGHLTEEQAKDPTVSQIKRAEEFEKDPSAFKFKETGELAEAPTPLGGKVEAPAEDITPTPATEAQVTDTIVSDIDQAKDAQIAPLATTADPVTVDKFQGVDALTLLEGIKSGELRADSKDATWRAMYRDGFATPEMVEAHNLFLQEQGVDNAATGFRTQITDFLPDGTPIDRKPEPANPLDDFLASGTFSQLTPAAVTNALVTKTITPTQALGAYNDVYNTQVEATKENLALMQNTINSIVRQGAQFTQESEQRLHNSMMNTFQTLDDTEEMFNEIEASLITAKQATFKADEERTTLERNIAIQQLQEQQKQSTLNFNSAMRDQMVTNQQNRIINETWAGVVGGFGTAMNDRLSTAMQSGVNALNQLRRQNNLDNEKFGNDFREIGDKYLSDMNILTAEKDQSIASIKGLYADKVAEVWADKATTRDEKMQQTIALEKDQNGVINDMSLAMANEINKANMDLAKTYSSIKMQQIKDQQARLSKTNAEKELDQAKAFAQSRLAAGQNPQVIFDEMSQRFGKSTMNLIEPSLATGFTETIEVPQKFLSEDDAIEGIVNPDYTSYVSEFGVPEPTIGGPGTRPEGTQVPAFITAEPVDKTLQRQDIKTEEEAIALVSIFDDEDDILESKSSPEVKARAIELLNQQ